MSTYLDNLYDECYNLKRAKISNERDGCDFDYDLFDSITSFVPCAYFESPFRYET